MRFTSSCWHRNVPQADYRCENVALISSGIRRRDGRTGVRMNDQYGARWRTPYAPFLTCIGPDRFGAPWLLTSLPAQVDFFQRSDSTVTQACYGSADRPFQYPAPTYGPTYHLTSQCTILHQLAYLLTGQIQTHLC